MTAAIIITVLACAVSAFALYFMATGVLGKLKQEVLRYIKIYNQYMEEPKEREEKKEGESTLKGVNSEAKETPLAIPFLPKSAATQKKDFFADYLRIRSSFSFDPQAVIDALPVLGDEAQKQEECINGLCETLNFDRVYRISCLKPETQLLILRESLTLEELTWLDAFLEDFREEFSVIAFSSYLYRKKWEHDGTIRLFSGEKNGKILPKERLTVCFDEKLCEGFQVIRGSRLYDYGLRSSDIML